MGQNQYSTITTAQNSFGAEVANIESQIEVKQQLTLVYMVLFECKTAFTNTNRNRIVDLQIVTTEAGGTVAGGSTIPPDLINGSDIAAIYHNHDTIYGSPTNVVTVSQTGYGADYSSIQAAIDSISVGSGKSIHVYKGIYTENITLKDGIPVFGVGSVGDVIENGKCYVNDGN